MSPGIAAAASLDLTTMIVREPLVVSPDMPVVEAIAQMGNRQACWCDSTGSNPSALSTPADNWHDLQLETQSNCAVVVDAGQVVGLFITQTMVALVAQWLRQNDTSSPTVNLTVGQVMVPSGVVLKASELQNPSAVIALFQQSSSCYIPVVDEQEQLVGLLTRSSLRQFMLAQQLLRSQHQESLIATIALRVRQHVGLDDILNTIVQEVREFLAADRVIVYQFHPDMGGTIVAEAVVPPWTSCLTQQINDTCFQNDFGGAYREGQISAIADVQMAELTECHHQLLAQFQVRANLVVPVLLPASDGAPGLWGLLVAHQCSAPRQWDTNEMRLLQQLSVQLAIALRQTDLYQSLRLLNTSLEKKVDDRTEELQALVQREQLIARIAAQIRASLNVHDILTNAVGEACSLLACDRVIIYKLRPDFSGTVVAESLVGPGRSILHSEVHDPCVSPDWLEPYRRGKVRVVNDIYTESMTLCHQELLTGLDIRAKLMVPIVIDEQLWGLMIASYRDRPYVWQTEDVELVWQLSLQLAIALKQGITHQQLQTELSERKQAEIQLRASEQRYGSLAAAAPVGIYRVDAAGCCIYINEKYSQITGLSLTDVAGRRAQSGLHPEDRDWVEAAWEMAVQQQGPFRLEYRFQRPDEAIAWVYDQAIAEWSDDGELMGYVGTITDISDRKQMELALRQSEAKSRAILTAIPDYLFQVGADGTYREVVTQHPKLMDLVPATINPVGRRLQAILPSDVADRHDYYLRQALQTGELQIYEQQVQIGETLQDEEVRVIKSGEDEVLFMIRNITEQKQAEAALKQSELTNRTIIESIPDLLIHMDRDGNYSSMLGGSDVRVKYPVASARPNIYSVLPPEQVNQRLYYTQRAIAENRLQIYEHIFDFDGDERYEEIRIAPLNDHEVLVIIRDITDRKYVEQQLRELNHELEAKVQARTADLQAREAQIMAMISAVPDLLLRVNRDGTCLSYIHPRHPDREFFPIQQHLAEALPPDLLQQQLAMIEQAIATNMLQVYEHHFPREGRTVYEEIRIGAINADEALIIVRDITDRKQTETALQKLVAGTAATVGRDFFPALVQYITEALQVSCAIVTELVGDELQSLAFWANGALQLPIAYHPAKTPCELTLQAGIFSCNGSVQAQFPDDRDLMKLGVDSYLGIALFNTHNQVMGSLCILDEGPIEDIQRAEHILRVFAARAAAELERQHVEAVMQRQLAAIEAAVDGIAILQDDKFLYVNQAHLHLFGYDQANELVGQSWRALYTPEQLDWFDYEIFPLLERDRAWQGEASATRKDGSTFAEGLSLTLTADGLLICVCRDITDRKLAESALQVSENRYRAIFNQIAVGINQTDASGRFVSANRAFCAMVGYTEAELLQLTFRDITHPDDLIRNRYSHEQLVSGKVALSLNEKRYRHKDGHYIWTQVAISTLCERLDKAQSEVAVVVNIDDRKRAEQELIQAKEAAEAAARAKSNFLATMSHEIRTPMNGVIGMLDLLQTSELNQTQQSHVAIARSSAESLLTLINDILDFSKVDAGKLELESLEFDLCQHIGEIIRAIAFKAHKKGLELALDLHNVAYPWVIGDPGRLRQILTNLVDNAIKFTETGTVLISGELAVTDKALLFTGRVTDSGVGIPPDNVALLFQSFTQGDASTTRRYGGTGLGLAISQKLCELMGGTITVQSEVGQGSCFEFTLTFQPSNGPPSFPLPLPLRGMKLLIVEAQPISRDVLSQQLTVWGSHVMTASTGAEALAQASQTTVNLVLVDHQLPDMDSIELAQALQQQSTTGTIPLVLMTETGFGELSAPWADAGVTRVISKPIIPSELQTALKLPVSPLNLPSPHPDQPLLGEAWPIPEGPLNWPTPARLLLVEDNRVNQLVVKGLLQKLGFTIDIVPNGKAALQILQQTSKSAPYRLIFMDCLMPEMDGYEASRRIRAGDAGLEHRQVVIVAMTANAMKGDDEICFAAGMNDYLTKPIKPHVLAEVLKKWLVPVRFHL